MLVDDKVPNQSIHSLINLQTKEEIAVLENDIEGLKRSIEEKMAPMKVNSLT